VALVWRSVRQAGASWCDGAQVSPAVAQQLAATEVPAPWSAEWVVNRLAAALAGAGTSDHVYPCVTLLQNLAPSCGAAVAVKGTACELTLPTAHANHSLPAPAGSLLVWPARAPHTPRVRRPRCECAALPGRCRRRDGRPGEYTHVVKLVSRAEPGGRAAAAREAHILSDRLRGAPRAARLSEMWQTDKLAYLILRCAAGRPPRNPAQLPRTAAARPGSVSFSPDAPLLRRRQHAPRAARRGVALRGADAGRARAARVPRLAAAAAGS
jgi:hypothetical protein